MSVSGYLPQVNMLREQWSRLDDLYGQIAEIEPGMREWRGEDFVIKVISVMPGVGLLIATAAVAMTGDAKAFGLGAAKV